MVRYRNLDEEGRLRFERKLTHRNANGTFLRQTLTYSPLSYACGPSMDQGLFSVSPKGYYILSADIVPEFVIGGDWFRFPIHFTPRYMVRIFHDDKAKGDSSLPVRTPSYMPGATIFIPLCSPGAILSSSYLKYLSISVFHHSNGQDGHEFLPHSRQLNHYNGNFSTNFVEPAYNFRYRSNIKPVAFSGGIGSRFHEWYGRLGYEMHFSTADTLKSSYGNGRWNLRLGWILSKSYNDIVAHVPVGKPYHRETWRAVLNATYINGDRDLGLSPIDNRLNIDLSIYRRIPSSPNTAVFTTVGYYGSDPYNIYYDQRYFYFRFGLAMGFFVSPLKGDEQ